MRSGEYNGLTTNLDGKWDISCFLHGESAYFSHVIVIKDVTFQASKLGEKSCQNCATDAEVLVARAMLVAVSSPAF